MKRIILILLLTFPALTIFAQNAAKGDQHSTTQNVFVKIDGASQNNWIKGDNDGASVQNSQSLGSENVSFTGTSTGIFVTIISGTNKIKLFALTGQLLLNGDLTQGRFFIPTRQGIYFLRVNNKSYKVICK